MIGVGIDGSDESRKALCVAVRLGQAAAATLRLIGLAAGCLAAGLLIGGCQFPADPDGTLERVEGGALRVGVTEHDPWVGLDGTRPAGVEVTLAERFAETLGAELEFTEGAEAELIDALKTGELDLVVGGFDSESP